MPNSRCRSSKRDCSRRSRRRMPIQPQAMNPDLDWAVWCGERQRRIEDVLARLLPAAERVPSPLCRAMRYAVLDGGKRMRPLLAYAAGELVAAPPDTVDSVAAAVEFVHAYSLIH